MLLNFLHHALGAFGRQHAVCQADCEDLVRADRRVWRRTVCHIVQTASVLVPKETIETPARDRCHVSVTLLTRLVPELAGQILHDAEGVIPERLDFNGLAAARRYDPVTDLGIHPGE